MKCPYCSTQLKKGEIVSGQGIHWHPEETSGDAVGSIRLSKTGVKGFLKSMQEGFSVEAHYCEACKKLIVSLE